jgi:hypothetical protein
MQLDRELSFEAALCFKGLPEEEDGEERHTEHYHRHYCRHGVVRPIRGRPRWLVFVVLLH